MPADSALVIVIVAIAINVLLVAGLLAPRIVARIRSSAARRSEITASAPTVLDTDLIESLAGSNVGSGLLPYDRVVRIVSWAFLMATALIAALSGLWPDRLSFIVVAVAIAGAVVLAIHDIIPAALLGRARGVLLALVAVTYSAVLVALTGGFGSPFWFAFPLIAGGGSLVVGRTQAAVIALVAAAAYLVGAIVGGGGVSTLQLAAVAVNLTGLFLLAYIGSVVGGEQRRSRDAALRLSAVDSLTGLYNRTTFFTALEREIARSDRSGRGFCLVMLDLDELKGINDRHGHHAGDEVLRAVAETVRNGVRRIDVAARYGGDEFVALLPETDPTGGWVLAEKIRIGVAEQAIRSIDEHASVSVGVVSYPSDGRSADALMIAADRAMYVSKRGGKNRVARAGGEPTVVALEPERDWGSSRRAV